MKNFQATEVGINNPEIESTYENELHYNVLKSSCYQLLDSGIKNMVLNVMKLM